MSKSKRNARRSEFNSEMIRRRPEPAGPISAVWAAIPNGNVA